MSELRELELEPDPGRGPKCVVAKLQTSRPDVYDDLIYLLDETDMSSARISRGLAEKCVPPVFVDQNRLSYHRRGDCKCVRAVR